MITILLLLMCLLFGGGGSCLAPMVSSTQSGGGSAEAVCMAEMVDYFPDARLRELPLYDAPHVSMPIVGYVPKGDFVRVIASQDVPEMGLWYRVEYTDQIAGWTMAGYLRGEENCVL